MSQVVEIPVEYKPLFSPGWREAAIYGGRYSLKSHTVARFLLIRARQQKTRVACFREFQNSIQESSHQLLADLIQRYELHDFEITKNSIINKINGSDFLFKGLWQNEQSIKSIEGIDIAWVEEAQTVSKSSLEVLTPTVRKPGSQIIYTYNRLMEDDPVHQRIVIEGRPNALIINVNYDIAIKYGMMPAEILAEINDDKDKRPALYKHKWLGEPNSLEMRIYKDWILGVEVPHIGFLKIRGLDFGYTNDPTALTDIYERDQLLTWDETLFQKGLSNKQIADVILNLPAPNTLVIADSAEPKSIDEIKSYGVNIIAANKGADSVINGIQLVQSRPHALTARSVNLQKEYLNYLFMTDKDGKILNVPEHQWSHGMDAGRYGETGLFKKPKFNMVASPLAPARYPEIGL